MPTRCFFTINSIGDPHGDITAFSCVIGIDIAKLVMQLFIVIAKGAIKNKSLKRKEFWDWFCNREASLIGKESCGGSQYWAIELKKLGHTVVLMPAKAVKPYLSGMKNNRNDAFTGDICLGIFR